MNKISPTLFTLILCLIPFMFSKSVFFLLFLLVVFLSTNFGGTKQGLLATCFAFLGYFYLGLDYTLLTVFLVASWMVIYLNESAFRIKRSLDYLAKKFDYVSSTRNDVVLTLNDEDKVICASKSTLPILGYLKEEILGQDIRNILPNPNSRFANKKSGVPIPVKVSEWSFDGSRKIIVITDISKQKEEEERIRLHKNRLEIVSNSITDSLVTINQEGIIIYCNPSTEKLFGHTMKELVGRPLTSLMPDRYHKKHKEGFKSYIESGKRKVNWKSVEFVGKRKDGSEVPLEISFGEYVERGEKYITSVIRDVSARKTYEVELQESKDRYQNLISNTLEGIWRLELTKPCPKFLTKEEQVSWILEFGYIAECNESMSNMYGFSSPEELIGKPLSFIKSRVLSSSTFLNTFISSEYNLHHLEVAEKLSNGSLQYFSTSLIGTLDDDGNLLRAWGIQRDISASKNHAIERERLLQESEIAKAMAEKANKEKDRFLANVSHELKTPLVAIIGYSGLLDETSDKSEFISSMDIIHRNALMQLELIEDLLDVSKIVANKITLHKEDFDLNKLTEDVITLFKPKAIEKKLTLTLVSEGLLGIHADPKRVRQILNNLISNAVRFTDEGGVEVKTWKDDYRVYISITDTGIGISKSDINVIFKPFEQADNTDQKKHKGVGLGLSIVKNLVTLHRGTVTVDSTLGKGSTFTVSLPKVSDDISFDGIKILLTEDNKDTGRLLKSFLEKHGAKVVWAKSAKQTYKLKAREKFDIYVFDIAMPDENGISLMQNIRKEGDKTPSVAISAFKTYEEEAIKSGFNKFVEKPLDWDSILSIKSLLRKS